MTLTPLILAKIASDWRKPNGQYVVTPDMINDFMIDLPVKKLYGVGKVTAEKLHKLDIHTCGDIQQYPITEFIRLFGQWGEQLHKMAHGIDDRPVITEWERKSLSVEHTFQRDYAISEISEAMLNELFSELCRRLEKSDKQETDIKTLFIKIKYNDFTSTTAQMPIQHFASSAFQELFKIKTKTEQRPIRLLGLGVHFNNEEARQIKSQLALDF
jgi:DNA polymerase-4